MLPSYLSALGLLEDKFHFVPGCWQLVVWHTLWNHKLQFLDVNSHENFLWILVVKLYLFVICVKIHCDHFAAVHFSYQPEENRFRVFCRDFDILSFLGIFNDWHDAITVQVKDVNDEFELFLFGGVPLENKLVFEVEIKGERFSDGQIDETLGLFKLLADPLGELGAEFVLNLWLLLDFDDLLLAVRLRVIGSDRGHLFIYLNWNGGDCLDLLLHCDGV